MKVIFLKIAGSDTGVQYTVNRRGGLIISDKIRMLETIKLLVKWNEVYFIENKVRSQLKDGEFETVAISAPTNMNDYVVSCMPSVDCNKMSDYFPDSHQENLSRVQPVWGQKRKVFFNLA